MACNIKVNASGFWYWEDGSIVSDSAFPSEEQAQLNWEKTLNVLKGSWLNPSLPKRGK